MTHPAVSGVLSSWNAVWVHYCDGSSWTSDRLEPATVAGGRKLFYRGWYILDALLADLEAKHRFLSNPNTEVVVGGTSAGGLAAYIHTAHFRVKTLSGLHPKARMVVIPDSSFFADLPNTKGQRVWGEGLRAAVGYGPPVPSPTGEPLQRIWNATRSIHPACLVQYPADPFRCFFPETLLPFNTASRVRTLVLNSGPL